MGFDLVTAYDETARGMGSRAPEVGRPLPLRRAINAGAGSWA